MKTFKTWANSSPSSTRPAHHANDTNSAFKNPWPSAEAPTWAELLSSKFPLGWYENLAKKHPNIKDVKVMKPDWGISALKSSGVAKEKAIIGTCLGHAGVLTEMFLEGAESFYAVYDPIFSERAGPTQYTGPQRLRPPPCQVTDLPGKHEIQTQYVLVSC
jgi:hypothetical protein